MLKKKNKPCMQIMLLFWVCKTHTPIMNGIALDTDEFFSKNQMKTWQESVDFWSGEFQVRFCEITDVHLGL